MFAVHLETFLPELMLMMIAEIFRPEPEAVLASAQTGKTVDLDGS